METFNIRHVRTHLSRLVEKAAKGEAFIIAKSGKPLVKVVPLQEPAARAVQPIGFMKGRIQIPDDFDRMGEAEIEW
ncbi:MAG TPA: type II toxin-antitoxin system prevent-host-death family antitoxin [Roseiarcus sp.]|nr:type II toxin-antitoxin system prevent-host-death family antitoxin [Roseiarcus sp.]